MLSRTKCASLMPVSCTARCGRCFCSTVSGLTISMAALIVGLAQTVLSFAKKFYELPPHQQELFHEQLLWHSKAAQRSFEERRVSRCDADPCTLPTGPFFASSVSGHTWLSVGWTLICILPTPGNHDGPLQRICGNGSPLWKHCRAQCLPHVHFGGLPGLLSGPRRA